MRAPSLEEWIELVQGFVERSLRGEDFDDAYFALFDQATEASDRGEPWMRDASPREVDGARMILDDLFVQVDRLTNDPEVSELENVTEDELRAAAARALGKLQRLPSGFSPFPNRPLAVLLLSGFSIYIVGAAATFLIYAVWNVLRWPFVRVLVVLRQLAPRRR